MKRQPRPPVDAGAWPGRGRPVGLLEAAIDEVHPSGGISWPQPVLE